VSSTRSSAAARHKKKHTSSSDKRSKERAETTLSELPVVSTVNPAAVPNDGDTEFSWVVYGDAEGDSGDDAENGKMPKPVYLTELKHEQQEPKWQDLDAKTRRASQKLHLARRASGRVSLSRTELGHNELFLKAYKAETKS
jgi:hypothetical protein